MILGAVSGHANVSKPVPHPREQTHLVQLYFDGSLSKAISLASWSSTRARLHAADGAKDENQQGAVCPICKKAIAGAQDGSAALNKHIDRCLLRTAGGDVSAANPTGVKKEDVLGCFIGLVP